MKLIIKMMYRNIKLKNTDVDLSGWTLVDKNFNVCIISKGILPKNKFAVFHRKDTIEYVDSVVYFKIDLAFLLIQKNLFYMIVKEIL